MQHRAGPEEGHSADHRRGGCVRAFADKGGVGQAAEERAHTQPLLVLEQLQPKTPAPGGDIFV